MGYPNNPLASGSNTANAAPAPAAFAPRPNAIPGMTPTMAPVGPAGQVGAASPGAVDAGNAAVNNAQAGAAAAFGLPPGAGAPGPGAPAMQPSLRSSIMNAMTGAGPAGPSGVMPLNPGAVPVTGPGAPAGVPPVNAPPRFQPPAPFGNPVPVRPGRMADAVRGYAGGSGRR